MSPLTSVPLTLFLHTPASVRADIASFSSERSRVFHLCPPCLCTQPNWDGPNPRSVEADRLRHEGNCLSVPLTECSVLTLNAFKRRTYLLKTL